MRSIVNKLLNIAIIGLALFAFQKVSDRLDRMGHTTQRLVQAAMPQGPLQSIPSGVPDDIDW